MKDIILIFLLILFNLSASSQSVNYLKAFGTDYYSGGAYSVIPQHDSGYVIIGRGDDVHPWIANDSFYYYKKFSKKHALEYTKYFKFPKYYSSIMGGGNTDFKPFIDLAGNYLHMANPLKGGLLKEVGVCLADSLGSIMWEKLYGGSSDERVSRNFRTIDGGVIFCSYSKSNDGDVGTHYGSQLYSDIWLLKLDSSYSKVWSKVYGSSEDDNILDLVELNNGDFIGVGHANKNDNDFIDMPSSLIDSNLWTRSFIIRMDSLGNKIWIKYPLDSVDFFPKAHIVLTNSISGDFTLCCPSKGGHGHHDPGGYGDITLAHFDGNGNLLWRNNYGGTLGEYTSGILFDTISKMYVILGSTSSSDGDVSTPNMGAGEDLWVIYVDTLGNLVKDLSIQGLKDDEPSELIETYLPNLYLVTGTSKSSDQDFSVVKQTFIDTTIERGFLAEIGEWETGLQEIRTSSSLNNSFTIYPNPSRNELMIQKNYEEPDGDLKVRIYSNLGSRYILKTWKRKKSILAIDITSLPSGIYLIELETDKHIQYHTKILKK